MPTATLLPLAAAAATFGLWLWTLSGQRQLARSAAARPLCRARKAAAAAGLFPCVAAALLSPFVPGTLIGLLASGAFLAHAALEPTKAGFYPRRRLRQACAGLVLLSGAALGFAGWHPELLPLAFALAVFHRHLAGLSLATARCYDDLDDLRAKIVSLETRRLTSQAVSGRGDDKVLKAG